MSVLGIAIRLGSFVAGGDEVPLDGDGHVTTHHWLLPEWAEILYGGLASLLIFAALIKFGGPAIRKAMAARTARIQGQLDDAAQAKAEAEQDATRIRGALGVDVAERDRLLAEAQQHAYSIREEGKARLASELTDVEAKGHADIAAAGQRVGDELRAEIARLSAAAVDHVVTGSLDEATHQELIENFIARVGAGR